MPIKNGPEAFFNQSKSYIIFFENGTKPNSIIINYLYPKH